MKHRKKKVYKLTENQLVNVGLAFINKSDCPDAKRFVRKLKKKHPVLKRR